MHRRKRGALRSSSMNWIPLRRQPFQTLLELSITEKRQNKAKCPTWISIRLELVKKKKCLTLSKVLNISKAGAWVAPDLLKALEILWDSGLRRYAVDQEDLKPSFKSEKKATFLEVISKPIYKFSKDFPNYRKKTNGVVFSRRPPQNILKYGDRRWDLPTIWKPRSLQTHIEEYSKYT